MKVERIGWVGKTFRPKIVRNGWDIQIKNVYIKHFFEDVPKQWPPVKVKITIETVD